LPGASVPVLPFYNDTLRNENSREHYLIAASFFQPAASFGMCNKIVGKNDSGGNSRKIDADAGGKYACFEYLQWAADSFLLKFTERLKTF